MYLLPIKTIVGACSILILFQWSQAIAKPTNENDRTFDFSYGATVIDAPENATIKIWFPIAHSNEHQQVTILETQTPNGSYRVSRDAQFANKIGFLEVKQSSKAPSFEINYRIHRQESRTKKGKVVISTAEKQLFLQENRLVPLTGKPADLLDGTLVMDSSLDSGRFLYDVVEQYMTYDKSNEGYGNGDVAWACDSHTGNCTDFHSLFISLARIKKIPARFEIGFPIPSKQSSGTINGYHCWAWFFTDENGWVPVDISEADKHPELKNYYFGNLTSNRVAFSTGRDIKLVPKSVAGPLNYFVYPHVEVDGVVWPKEKIQLKFSFEDVVKSVIEKSDR